MHQCKRPVDIIDRKSLGIIIIANPNPEFLVLVVGGVGLE